MNGQYAYDRINSRVVQLVFLVLALGSALGGCTGRFPYDRPFALNQQSTGALQIDSGLQTNPSSQNESIFYTLLEQYRSGSDPAGARNAILHKLLLMDDVYFLRYTLTLYNGRAYADATSEIINTSLTLAATAVAPAQAAKVLTGIAAGLSAAKISIDKNIFLQQATPALIAKMEAQRAEVRTDMVRLMEQPVAVYSLEDGLSDFVRYFRAGTLSAAAQSLTANAEQEHTLANQSLQQAKIGRYQGGSFTAPRSGINFTPRPPRHRSEDLL